MYLARGQKDLSVGEFRSTTHILLVKPCFARRRISLQRFRTEWKLARVIGERVFPPSIRDVSSLNDKRAGAIEPWILRRKRFSWRWNESTHPIKDHCPYLFSRDRSVPRDKARFTPMIVSKEAAHCPPIKVPESTFRTWWSLLSFFLMYYH